MEFGNYAGIAALVAVFAAWGEVGQSQLFVSRGNLAGTAYSDALRRAGLTGIGATVLLALGGLLLVRRGSDLAALLLILAPGPLVRATGAVALGALRLKGRFGRVAAINSAGAAIAVASSLALARLGWGARALAAGGMASEIAICTAAALSIRGTLSSPDAGTVWRVTGRSVGPWRASTEITLGGLAWIAALNVDNLIVGGILGSGALGAYALAYNYGSLPGTTVGSVVGQVALPAFAACEREEREKRETAACFLLFARLNMLFTSLVVAAGIPLAWHLGTVVLGPAWSSARLPLAIMLFAGGVRGFMPTDELLYALGRQDVPMKVGLFVAPALLALVAVGAWVGGVTLAILASASVLTVAVVASTVTAVRLAQVRLRSLCGIVAIHASGMVLVLCVWQAVIRTDGTPMRVAELLAFAAIACLLGRVAWGRLRMPGVGHE